MIIKEGDLIQYNPYGLVDQDGRPAWPTAMGLALRQISRDMIRVLWFDNWEITEEYKLLEDNECFTLLSPGSSVG